MYIHTYTGLNNEIDISDYAATFDEKKFWQNLVNKQCLTKLKASIVQLMGNECF